MENELIILFTSYPRLLKQLFKDFDYSRFGFSKAVLMILFGLRYRSKGKSLKMSELESHSGLKKSTLSESVDLLVRNGYIERKRSEKDRRVVRVKLTKKGEKRIDEITKIAESYMYQKLKILSDEEMKKLFDAFKVIEDVAEKLKGANKNAKC